MTSFEADDEDPNPAKEASPPRGELAVEPDEYIMLFGINEVPALYSLYKVKVYIIEIIENNVKRPVIVFQ